MGRLKRAQILLFWKHAQTPSSAVMLFNSHCTYSYL